MGTFANMNDPRESKAWMFSMTFSAKPPAHVNFFAMQEKAEEIIKGTCKVLCFTRDDPAVLQDNLHNEYGRGYAHPHMWAQYGGNHKGVCLIFDREKLSKSVSVMSKDKNLFYEGPVIYRDEDNKDDFYAFKFNFDDIEQVGFDKYVEQHVSKFYRALFFRKALDWFSEWEYRFLLKSSDNADKFISINDSLCVICLGADFPRVYEPLVASTCRSLDIQDARIQWRNGFPIIMPAF